jgi:hypothetical protein
MKKPIVPRFIALILIYGAFFLLLAMIQFSRGGSFTHTVGHLVISGSDQMPVNPASPSDEYLLTRGAGVFFGGMEFRMDERSEFALRYKDGNTEKVVPDYMVLSHDTAFFRLPGGSGLNFSVHDTGGRAELRISGNFDAPVWSVELPFRPLRKSRIRDAGNGTVLVTANGLDYTFRGVVIDPQSRILSIGSGEISYRVVPEDQQSVPTDLIIPAALDIGEYEAVLTQWREQSFALWSRNIGMVNDEELISAYLGESARRGSYKAAVAAVAPAFLNGDRRTFRSSVYLGRMDTGLRSISAYERKTLSRLSRQINEKSPEFLGESHVFEYLSIRNNGPLINSGMEIVQALEPALLSLDIAAGVLEGWHDWRLYRPLQENPFDRLVEPACSVIFGALKKSPQDKRVFVFSDTTAQMELNLRAGKALAAYGETVKNETQAALGRSLILSVLSSINPSGLLSETLTISDQGEITDDPQSGEFNSARLYHMLNSGYPRAVTVGPSSEGIWAWTAVETSSVRENNVLDISVSFTPGDTHYMMIRGIRPFSKIQLYGIDFRTDPQFERYDSSGWSYSASEQTLLLKIRHRETVEHIRIFS